VPAFATPFEAIGGADTIRRLVEAFYPRVQADPALAPIFPADITPVMERQRLFLTQFLGGPGLYSATYGHPMLRARHLPHAITPARRDAWLRCMAAALADIGLPADAREEVLARLAPVAAHMVNRQDAPDGASTP
jgi:hemoglobin